MKKTIYNKKNFLLPTSPNSMACYHAKIESENGEDTYKLSIHDCKSGIMLYGKLNTTEQRQEALQKLGELEEGIYDLKCRIYDLYQ